MIGSVHIADVGLRHMPATVRLARKRNVPGPRHCHVALAAPLRGSGPPSAQPGRVAFIGFWENDAALDAFEHTHPLASALAGGWSMRLQPLRMWGSWPGVPADLPRTRHVEYDGPAAVLTLGRLRFKRAIPFFRTSAKAERAARRADGMLWATALALPPFVATCSLWRDAASIATYAFAHGDSAHPDAIAADRAKSFHHQEAFIRWRPYAAHGHLDGRNPLPESVAALVATP